MEGRKEECIARGRKKMNKLNYNVRLQLVYLQPQRETCIRLIKHGNNSESYWRTSKRECVCVCVCVGESRYQHAARQASFRLILVLCYCWLESLAYSSQPLLLLRVWLSYPPPPPPFFCDTERRTKQERTQSANLMHKQGNLRGAAASARTGYSALGSPSCHLKRERIPGVRCG